MRVAVIGSRDIELNDISPYIPPGTTELISGGARGVDSLAAQYAVEHGIKLTEFLPEYERYGRGAPLRRNEQIVDMADMVVAIWDGKSRGTKFTVNYAVKKGKPISVSIALSPSPGGK